MDRTIDRFDRNEKPMGHSRSDRESMGHSRSDRESMGHSRSDREHMGHSRSDRERQGQQTPTRTMNPRYQAERASGSAMGRSRSDTMMGPGRIRPGTGREGMDELPAGSRTPGG